MRMPNLPGRRYGKLILIEEIYHRRWKCKCDCGNFHEVGTSNLNYTNSCGCSKKAKSDEIYHEKLRNKILKLILKENECWNWSNETRTGYGSTRYRGKGCLAHRLSWIVFKGKIPEGAHVLHKCDNRKCVNPDHLFIGNHSDNMKDMFSKGRRSHVGDNHPRRKHVKTS